MSRKSPAEAEGSFSTLRQKFKHLTTEGLNLMSGLLSYDPARRLSAEEAVKHVYFESVWMGGPM